jgi:DNA-binding CsgD family transcriptional regulator
MSRFSMLFSKSANRAIPNLQLKPGTLVLGRSPSCDYVVDDGSVSRRHANIALTDGRLTVEDLGSSNRTFLDGRAVDSCTVYSGQSLRFGKVAFIYLTWQDDAIGSDEETDKCAELDELMEPGMGKLTATQAQIFNEVLCGFDEKAIAKRVHRSPHTVHNHLRVIYRVFEVHSRAELLAKALSKDDKPLNLFS